MAFVELRSGIWKTDIWTNNPEFDHESAVDLKYCGKEFGHGWTRTDTDSFEYNKDRSVLICVNPWQI